MSSSLTDFSESPPAPKSQAIPTKHIQDYSAKGQAVLRTRVQAAISAACEDAPLEPPFEVNPEALRSQVEGIMDSAVDSIEVISESNAHKVYAISLQNGANFVACVARNVNPLKMVSEEATRRYLYRSSLSVPKTLLACFDASSPVGGQWMLMTTMEGIRLTDVYDTLSKEEKVDIFKQLTAYTHNLCKTRLPTPGSVLTGQDGSANLGPPAIIEVLRSYGAGMRVPHEGYHTLQDYLLACLERERAAVQGLNPDVDNCCLLTIEGLLMCLESIEHIIRSIDWPPLGLMLSFALCPDWRLSNILVDAHDQGLIVGLIDWDCASSPSPSMVANLPERLLCWEDEPAELVDAIMEASQECDIAFARQLTSDGSGGCILSKIYDLVSALDYREMTLIVHEFEDLGFTKGWGPVPTMFEDSMVVYHDTIYYVAPKIVDLDFLVRGDSENVMEGEVQLAPPEDVDGLRDSIGAASPAACVSHVSGQAKGDCIGISRTTGEVAAADVIPDNFTRAGDRHAAEASEDANCLGLSGHNELRRVAGSLLQVDGSTTAPDAKGETAETLPVELDRNDAQVPLEPPASVDLYDSLHSHDTNTGHSRRPMFDDIPVSNGNLDLKKGGPPFCESPTSATGLKPVAQERSFSHGKRRRDEDEDEAEEPASKRRRPSLVLTSA